MLCDDGGVQAWDFAKEALDYAANADGDCEWDSYPFDTEEQVCEQRVCLIVAARCRLDLRPSNYFVFLFCTLCFAVAKEEKVQQERYWRQVAMRGGRISVA